VTNACFRIYLAAPLFNERERAFNLALTHALEALGAEVFLPQRDGALLVEMLSGGVPQLVAERRVFLQDTEAMRAADLGVAVLDGAVVDDGVAFEIGYLFALGTRCIGLQSDVRRALPSGNNPMIGQALMKIACDQSSLLASVGVAMETPHDMRRVVA
jgi:nucleoside 2-deoxyribosyltransferase